MVVEKNLTDICIFRHMMREDEEGDETVTPRARPGKSPSALEAAALFSCVWTEVKRTPLSVIAALRCSEVSDEHVP